MCIYAYSVCVLGCVLNNIIFHRVYFFPSIRHSVASVIIMELGIRLKQKHYFPSLCHLSTDNIDDR